MTSSISNKNGNCPVGRAAVMGHFNVVQCLVQNGANIHTRNKEGNTPMFRAAIRHEPINLNSNYRCICLIYISICICLLLHINPNGAGRHIVPTFLMTVVKLCVHFYVCVSKKLRKWTHTDTKVTFHPPPTHQKTFFGLK